MKDITCDTGTVIPTNNAPIKCPKGLINSDCIIFEEANVYLGLPVESTLTEVIGKIAAKLQLMESQQ